jgi:hypothetical protein
MNPFGRVASWLPEPAAIERGPGAASGAIVIIACIAKAVWTLIHDTVIPGPARKPVVLNPVFRPVMARATVCPRAAVAGEIAVMTGELSGSNSLKEPRMMNTAICASRAWLPGSPPSGGRPNEERRNQARPAIAGQGFAGVDGSGPGRGRSRCNGSPKASSAGDLKMASQIPAGRRYRIQGGFRPEVIQI